MILTILILLCLPIQHRYPRARAFKRKFVYHAGPTNSGKTHSALERFLAAHTGIYCAPLRMLAHEIYRRSNARGTPCDLLTGDEKQFASGDPGTPSGHLSCTVEMANVESYCESLLSSTILLHTVYILVLSPSLLPIIPPPPPPPPPSLSLFLPLFHLLFLAVWPAWQMMWQW